MKKDKEQIGIPVMPNNTYVYAGPATEKCFYDADGNELSRVVLHPGKNTFTAPGNAKYFGNKINKIQRRWHDE